VEPAAPSRWPTSLVLFAVVALGYTAWRAPGDLVWDDTPTVLANLYTAPSGPIISFADPYFLRSMWRQDFGAVHVDGYRPLNWAVRRVSLAIQAGSAWAPAGFLALNAVLAGLLAVALFWLARRFTRTMAGALFSVFLVLGSTPLLTGFLVLFTGIQALVPLAMCAALNCYFASLDSKRPRSWLLWMGLLLFVAPLYREFAGVAPLLILCLEIQGRRWRSGAAFLSALAFAHALFPTALPHYLFFPDLAIAPVYQLGALGAQARAGIEPNAPFLTRIWQAALTLKWRIFLDLVSILPPTLFLLALGGWAATALRRRTPAIPWRLTAFLVFFFLLTFLPFLKVFKEQVHLAYCLVPASIILAASVEALWREAAAVRWAPRLLVAGLVLIVVSDHALNPFIVRAATRDCYAAIGRVTATCTREMPEGSILLSNAHHAADVCLLVHGRFALNYTVMSSGRIDLLIDCPAALYALRKSAGDKRIFCLDVSLPRRRGQPGGDRIHWVVRDRPVELCDLGAIDRVSYRYAFVDPLKLLIPIRNTPWPGSPDLEYDYYRGPALDGTPFVREVAASYHLFEVVGAKSGFEEVTDGPPGPTNKADASGIDRKTASEE
jgi:hypothetical protein